MINSRCARNVRPHLLRRVKKIGIMAGVHLLNRYIDISTAV
jgi:hypothetical protein